MKQFLKILGVIIIISSILLGAYVGIYLLLYGGIVQIVNNINPMNGKEVAIGVIRALFCEVGGLITGIGITIGTYIIKISR